MDEADPEDEVDSIERLFSVKIIESVEDDSSEGEVCSVEVFGSDE